MVNKLLKGEIAKWRQNFVLKMLKNDRPAGDVPVYILLLGKVLEALGNVVGHRGQPLVGDLVQLLTVSLVYKMSPRQKIPFSEYKFFFHTQILSICKSNPLK